MLTEAYLPELQSLPLSCGVIFYDVAHGWNNRRAPDPARCRPRVMGTWAALRLQQESTSLKTRCSSGHRPRTGCQCNKRRSARPFQPKRWASDGSVTLVMYLTGTDEPASYNDNIRPNYLR